MINNPKVSVIIPTYNHRSFIAATIDSALEQSFRDLEIIIADDASDDGTPEIVKNYASKYPNIITAVFGEKRLGIAANLNRAFKLAKGEYICWLGGDDLMYPKKIEKQVKYLDAHSNITGCHHDVHVYDEDLHKVVGVFSELYSRGTRKLVEGGVEILFDPGAFMLPSSIMVRRMACPVHGFDERLRYANDWLFDIETFRNGRIGALNEVLGLYRRHKTNVTSSADLQERTLEESLIVLGIVVARYPDLAHLAKRRRMSFLLAEMVKRYQAGDFRSSFLYMKSAWLDGAFVKAPLLYLGLSLMGRTIFKHFELNAYGHKRLMRRLRTWFKI
ncbi:MAG: glycosyltransferase [Candidatus Bathyarchaeia archaeon]